MLTVTINDSCSVSEINEAIGRSDKSADILLISGKAQLHDALFDTSAADNMSDVLYRAEKHAVVCGMNIEAIHSAAARKYLPEYSKIVKPTPDLVLIKRSVVNNLGFLDTGYSSVQYALTDFCARINAFGYTAVMAHRATYNLQTETVPNQASSAGATKKEEKRAKEISKDEKRFNKKHKFYAGLIRRYEETGSHPIIRFIELLTDSDAADGGSRKKKILFDCIIMPPFYNGTAQYQISLFDAFNRLYNDKYDISMYVTREADAFHGLSRRYDNILYPDTIGDEVFDLGFAPNQLFNLNNQIAINKRCLKIIQTIHDIIALRCFEQQIGEPSYEDIAKIGLKLTDGIITISKSGMRDLQAFFQNDTNLEKTPIKPILIASDPSKPRTGEVKLPFDEYFLIVGNSFKHKALKEAVTEAKKMKQNFIVVGYGNNKFIFDNVYGYKSGYLDDKFLAELYAKCKAVIFPSLYEGFGLPVAIGLINQKRVIAANTDVNRELKEYYKEQTDGIMLFDRFEQIGEIILNTDFTSNPMTTSYQDSWDKVAKEVSSFFDQILKSEIDIDRLCERLFMYNFIEAKLTNRSIKYFLKEYAKHKLPRLFRFTKKANTIFKRRK